MGDMVYLVKFLIWRFGGPKKIAKFNSANIKSRSAVRLAIQIPGILCTVPVLQHTLYTPQKMRSRVNLCNMRCALGPANHGPTCSKVVSPQSKAKYEFILDERVKMGSYGAKKDRARVARHFFRWLGGKLP